MLPAKFQNHRPSGIGGEDFFKDFYNIQAWWLSWSCDLNHLYKLSFPFPMDSPYEIWL